MVEAATSTQDLETIEDFSRIDDRGECVDEVAVEIDYAIIDHFSKHLYGSANKAIEELTSNGFDAFASEVYVYIPGSFADDCVLVWDDGHSMDLGDLHKLWWIAQSTKTGDRIAWQGNRNRAMIGKFGIGKLASYAVGHRITHLCRYGDRFLRVSVDYRRVPHLTEGSTRQPYRAPIVELSPEEACEYVTSLFRQTPAALSHLWDKDRWTLAIIDNLKSDSRLSEGRLRWILGNGMPLRPDFRIWLNDQEVRPKLDNAASVEWDASEPKLQEALESSWKSARIKTDVTGEPKFVPASGEPDSKAVIRLPMLGPVRVEVRIFEGSLLPKNTPDSPRSHGFFVMVRGRLLNQDDDKLLLSDPSFGAFYRCQFVIYADGLDQDLLADRGRLHSDTPRTKELAVLQHALYLAARNEIEQLDERNTQARRSESLLPVESREHFREPLTALVLRHQQTLTQPFDVADARIERVPLDEDEPLAVLDDGGRLKVNQTHPLFDSVQKKLGEGKKAREAMQVFDLFAVSERLLEGFLFDIGLPDDQIERILRWRDGLFRSIATRFASAPIEEIVREVREASHLGAREFERALTKLFEHMGFVAERDGARGQKDILVVAPIGKNQYRFTVEAKGSKNSIVNDAAEVSAAAAHRDATGASLAVIVAREFAGFEREGADPPAILQECRATRDVSIVTVEVLEELYRAIHCYAYPLDLLLPVLAKIESPSEKLKRVQALQHPVKDFDFRGVLEEIWRRQQGEAAGDLVPYRTVWQSEPTRWGTQDFEDFERRLLGLESLAGSGLVRISQRQQVVTLNQNPEIVAERIQNAVNRQP